MNNEFSRRTFLKTIGMGAVALSMPEFNLASEKYIANIGIQLYTIRKQIEKDFSGTIKKIADIGYLGIETYPLPENVSLESAAKGFKDNGLEIFSMHTEMPEGDYLNEVYKFAEAYNCKRVVYPGWPQGDKFANKDATQKTAERYNKAFHILKSKGLQFGLHNHWWEFEMVDGIYPFYYLLENLEPEIFFEIDTYWAKTAGLDPAKILKDFGKRAPLLHIKDGPAIKGDKAYEQVPVGKGVMDIKDIVNAGGENIKWMIVEFDEYAGDIFEGAESSYKYLVKNSLGKGKK